MTKEEVLKLVEEHFGKGCMEICEERHEQVNKHGFDVKNDQDYSDNELLIAARFAMHPFQFEWPFHWMEKFRQKIREKNAFERIRISGAFIAAELDRMYGN